MYFYTDSYEKCAARERAAEVQAEEDFTATRKFGETWKQMNASLLEEEFQGTGQQDFRAAKWKAKLSSNKVG